MKIRARLKKNLLSPRSAILAVISAIVLIFAFPDFEVGFLAWMALVPLFFALGREKDSIVKSFLVGWMFGVVFFFGSCWWLTFAPITYAKIPTPITYFFLLCAASIVGIFPGIFGALLSVLLRRFEHYGILAAPFLWTATEFLRMWLTGNNWNALGYSQAFNGYLNHLASLGGVLFVSFVVAVLNTAFYFSLSNNLKKNKLNSLISSLPAILLVACIWTSPFAALNFEPTRTDAGSERVVAVQPNVPMSGLTYEKYQELLARHINLAETALKKRTDGGRRTTVIFPESPMIFQFGRDTELREFLRDFAVRNNASVLFNSAEMTPDEKRVLNSAVMIDERGEKRAQYDKIHLVPFGEYIPFPEPLASRMPAFVGNFEFGDEYDLLPFGEATGGVMICFESHFGELSREYALRGADVLIEMTNDGYLGETPVLRQHLANSVFRAVETARPVIRVTNVGVTAYIDQYGIIKDEAPVYEEATRVWTISKTDGAQTFYVRYGDWFAWTCSLLSLALLLWSFRKKREIQK